MTPPRDVVTCKQCGAVLGTFVDGRPGGGRQNRNEYRMQSRFDLCDNVVVYLTLGRVDIYCPACGQTREVDLARYDVIVRGRAA